MITIKAEKRNKDSASTSHASRDSFWRSLRLPEGLDTNAIQATYRNGILEIHVLKSEKAKPKRIAVQG